MEPDEDFTGGYDPDDDFYDDDDDCWRGDDEPVFIPRGYADELEDDDYADND